MSVLDVDTIRFSWPGQPVPVLENFSLEVDKTESVLVTGPSGCGKSSLLSLLAGITVVDAGSLRVLDTELASLRSAERDRFRAEHIGYIFQEFNLIPYLSVLENVLLAGEFGSGRRRRSAVEALGLLEGLGLEEAANRPVTELSVGQQQRVAAARALLGGPELILADEPTSALDAEHRDRFVEQLFTLCEANESALVFVSHDRELSRLFSRTVEVAP